MPSRGSSQTMSCATTTQTGVKTRKPLPGTEAAYYFITRSSLCIGAIDGSRQRLLDRSLKSREGYFHRLDRGWKASAALRRSNPVDRFSNHTSTPERLLLTYALPSTGPRRFPDGLDRCRVGHRLRRARKQRHSGRQVCVRSG